MRSDSVALPPTGGVGTSHPNVVWTGETPDEKCKINLVARKGLRRDRT